MSIFYAIVESVETLEIFVDAFLLFGTIARVECTQESIVLKCMANNRAGYVTAKLPSFPFTWFQCRRSVNFALDLYCLKSVLSSARPGDTCVLRLSEDIRALKLILTGVCFTHISEHHLIVNEVERDGTHSLSPSDFDAIANISSAEFHHIVKHMSRTSSVIRIRASKLGISFSINNGRWWSNVFLPDESEAPRPHNSVRGEELGSYSQPLQNTRRRRRRRWTSVDVKCEAEAFYSSQELHKITRNRRISTTVVIMLSRHYPLRVIYKFEDGHVQFNLAPLLFC